MQRIPFYRPSVGQDEIDEVVATLKGGWLTTGPKTKQFESEFGAYIRQRHSVAVNSCTAALHLALEAIGVQRDEGVLVPTMTFAATAEVVRYFGARPVLVDCRQDDFNLDVADAERRIAVEHAAGRRVVAIMPVHYGGQIGDVDGVRRLATRHGLKVIEDAAHCCPAYCWDDGMASAEGLGIDNSSVGATARVGTGRTDSFAPPPAESGDGVRPGGWRSVGADADISCYSFYANKTITTGEGGMACTNHDAYADRMRIMSLHGISRDAWKRFTAEGSWYYEIIAPGFKYNLTDIASAIGIHQVRKADRLHRMRMALAAQYQARLADLEEILLPTARPDRVHSWHLFPIRLRPEKARIERVELIAELQRRGIGTSVHWLPLHMHPYYRETYGYKPEDYPIAAGLYPGLVTLPLYPDMGEDAVDRVCSNLKELVGGG